MHNEYVIKYFKDLKVMKTELNNTASIVGKGVVRILDCDESLKIIKYERLKTISNLESYLDIKNILLDISIALYNIHKSGYYHGDVSVHNIGLNSKDKYVLYDFENSGKLPDNIMEKTEKQYKDVEMFLENLIINCKSYFNTQTVLYKILNEMKKSFTKTEYMYIKSFNNSYKKREIRFYNYNTEDFIQTLNSIL
jgi:tRNA A-37 threonylcarbamoyl transferase component Bud32